MQKISLITTVKNEENSIGKFLDSVSTQTRKPEEVIIVDGGSTDRTVELIQKAKVKRQNLKLKVKIIEKKGNRSVGRNTAIKASSNNIIAVTDAGCVLDSHWLERIVKPFEDKSVDVVAGFYKPKTRGVFEKCLSTYTCTMQDRLDTNNFLPSSRSVAFKKETWEKVKGYPENLDTCEDLVFDKKLKKAGLKFVTVENAFVWWPQRKNIFGACKQFYNYAKGDGQARNLRSTMPFLFGRYLLGLGFLLYILFSSNYSLITFLYPLIFLYILWVVLKNYKYVKKPQAVIYLPILQLTSDIATIAGNSVGYFSRRG